MIKKQCLNQEHPLLSRHLSQNSFKKINHQDDFKNPEFQQIGVNTFLAA